MANGQFATTETDEDFEIDSDVTGALTGWRIERNNNGFYRYRWQIKDGRGNPDVYITSSCKTGYRRGSKYLPKLKALQEIHNGSKRR